LKVLFSILLSFTVFSCFAQQDGDITISGRAVDRNGNNTLVSIMVVNQQSGTGTFAGTNGAFSITAKRKDTIMITARDCAIKKLCFRDSAYKTRYSILVKLDTIHYELNDVYIHPTASLPEIHKSIDNLGVKQTDTYKTVDITSPITALYERFSRIEQSKRKVAAMEDDDARRAVLKDLFHLYIKYDIINLSDKDFDNFIDFCNFSDDFMQRATDYELVMAVKQRYQRFNRASGNDYYNKK
jgi:hypothetical protein